MWGTLPSELGLMTNLKERGLNAFIANLAIPSEIGLLSSLTSIELQENNLRGTIPNELGQLGSTLVEFNLKGNSGLNGTIPEPLCQVSSLEVSCDSLCGCSCQCA